MGDRVLPGPIVQAARVSPDRFSEADSVFPAADNPLRIARVDGLRIG